MPLPKVNSSDEAIQLEDQHGAHNYHPLPAVLSKGRVFMSGMLKAKNIMIFYRLIPQ